MDNKSVKSCSKTRNTELKHNEKPTKIRKPSNTGRNKAIPYPMKTFFHESINSYKETKPLRLTQPLIAKKV